MECKDRIIGIRFTAPPTQENVIRCSELSAAFLNALVKRCNITYNQILYPYADALSLSGAEGTESTRIFGTHILLRNIQDEAIETVMQQCFTAENQPVTDKYEALDLPLTDSAAKSSDIAEFLSAGEEFGLPWVGDFTGMLAGWLPHWRIRESARNFASFSEMAYRRSGRQVIGLYGGKLILTPQCDCPEALSEIFTQKTGAVCR